MLCEVRKEKTSRERELEKERGKKRYIERVIEEHEADEEIREYEYDREEFPERED